jgi:hypothetical protein
MRARQRLRGILPISSSLACFVRRQLDSPSRHRLCAALPTCADADNTEGSCRYGAPDNVYYAAWSDKIEGFPNCGMRATAASASKGPAQGLARRRQHHNTTSSTSGSVPYNDSEHSAGDHL